MQQLGYVQCKANNDLWMKPMFRPTDGLKYYAYILLYVDDALCVHHDGQTASEELDYFFKMKDQSIGDPEMYLGAKIKKMVLPNGVEAWAMSPSKYVQNAI